MTKEKTIGIIGAMRSEMDAIKGAVKDPEREIISGIEFIKGRLEGVPVVVATCGVGKVFAGMCTQTMILRYSPDSIINVGVAGSLTPELNIGDIAVAKGTIQYDMDSSGLGDSPGMISGIEIIEIPCDEKMFRGLENSARRQGYHFVRGIIATGDTFINEKKQKKRITDIFPAIACEMEGAGVGQVCYVNDVPFCVLRAISDNGDEEAEGDYPISLEMAADRASRVLLDYLKTGSAS